MTTAVLERPVTYEQASYFFDLPKVYKDQEFIMALVPKKPVPFYSESEALDWSEEMTSEWW
jgi:hypothetical protein